MPLRQCSLKCISDEQYWFDSKPGAAPVFAYRTTANGMQQALLRSMHPHLLFSVHSLFKVLISIAHHQQYCYSTGVILFVCKLIASW